MLMSFSLCVRAAPLVVLLALFLVRANVHAAWSDRTTLYGLTYDGILLRIDPTTGVGTQVRDVISEEFRDLDSLEFHGSCFYASYGSVLKDEQGAIVEFGPDPGDERGIGHSGYPYLEAFMDHPDGTLYATVSLNTGSQAEAVGRFDLSSPEYELITDVVVSSLPDEVYNLDAAAFDSSGTLFVINLDEPYLLARFDELDGSVTPLYDVEITHLYVGLAIEFQSDRLFATSIRSRNYRASRSTLYEIDRNSGKERLIGNLGFRGVMGLTYGPANLPTCVPEL